LHSALLNLSGPNYQTLHSSSGAAGRQCERSVARAASLHYGRRRPSSRDGLDPVYMVTFAIATIAFGTARTRPASLPGFEALARSRVLSDAVELARPDATPGPRRAPATTFHGHRDHGWREAIPPSSMLGVNDRPYVGGRPSDPTSHAARRFPMASAVMPTIAIAAQVSSRQPILERECRRLG
jgi:hypothetical protein